MLCKMHKKEVNFLYQVTRITFEKRELTDYTERVLTDTERNV